MAQQEKVGTVHTTIRANPENGLTEIVYHSTCVVAFNHEKIILNHAGYRTPTTKVRMTQASNQFDLGYQVYQKGGQWFVDFEGMTYDFDENKPLTLIRDEFKRCPDCGALLETNNGHERLECTSDCRYQDKL